MQMKRILGCCGRGESTWRNWTELNFSKFKTKQNKTVALKNMEHAAWVILTIYIFSCSLCGKKLQTHTKYLYLCSMEERKSYRFGRTWGWVNNDNFPLTTWAKYPTLHKIQIRSCCQHTEFKDRNSQYTNMQLPQSSEPHNTQNSKTPPQEPPT